MSDPSITPATPKPLSRKQRQTVKTRQRAAQKRARQAEIDRITDAKSEQLAEDQAPAAQRTNGNAVPDLKRGGYRRADPLLRMFQNGRGRTVTRTHLIAARRFSEDYEVGVEGACCRAGDTVIVDGGGGGLDISDTRLDALARYRGACDAMGPSLRGVAQAMALHRWSLVRMATVCVVSEDQASVLVVAALDRLSDWYWPERVSRAELIDRALIVDLSVVDIGQDRLGRASRGHANVS
jgi:hypothetical protein